MELFDKCKFEAQGEFWIPGKEDQRIQCSLRIRKANGDNIELWVPRQDASQIETLSSVKVWFGVCRDGYVALYGCRSLDIFDNLDGTVSIPYVADSFCVFEDYSPISNSSIPEMPSALFDVNFASVAFGLEHLSEWLGHSILSLEYKEKGIIIEAPKENEIRLPTLDNIDIRILYNVQPFGEMSLSKKGVKAIPYIEISHTDGSCITYDNAILWVKRFMSILTISCRRAVNLTWFGGNLHGLKPETYISIYTRSITYTRIPVDVDIEPVYNYEMAFNFSDIGEDEGLKAMLENIPLERFDSLFDALFLYHTHPVPIDVQLYVLHRVCINVMDGNYLEWDDSGKCEICEIYVRLEYRNEHFCNILKECNWQLFKEIMQFGNHKDLMSLGRIIKDIRDDYLAHPKQKGIDDKQLFHLLCSFLECLLAIYLIAKSQSKSYMRESSFRLVFRELGMPLKEVIKKYPKGLRAANESSSEITDS